jgi:hypothetical protein
MHFIRRQTAAFPVLNPTAAHPELGEWPPAPQQSTMTTTRGWLTRPIFITSTFRDMQAERDWLGQRVFPELQERLRGRRVVIEPIDLRLGVDTASVADEGQRELQVLQVSLAEIARSRPFLIGLIGERYGWIPPPERMQAAAAEAGFAGEIAGRSVTELEIAYGVLASPAQQRRSFFYLREPLPCSEMDPAVAADYAEAFATDASATERAERAQKLLALKARLAEELPDRLRPYHATWNGQTVSGLEAFGKQVFEDLWRELDLETRDRIGAPAPTWQESERETLQEFLDWRATGFIGRQAELERLEGLCLGPGPDGPALCLTGEAGAGKSALLAALAQRLAAAAPPPGAGAPADSPTEAPADAPADSPSNSPLLLVHAAGVSPRAGQADTMVRRWVGELAEALGIPEPIDERTAFDELRSAFHDLLRRTAAKRRVVLLIDALNQFVSGSPLSWLPTRLPENLRLIASTLPGPESEAATQAGFACEALPPIDEAAARRIVETLCDRYHRKLNERVLQALLARRLPDGRPACGNPLWLTLAVDELNLLDAADFARAERAEADPTLLPAERLTRFLIGIAEKKLPETVGPAYQWLLRRAEAVHCEARCRAFAESLALEHYLPKESQRRAGHARLAAHFGGLAADDPLHQSETMGHLIGADDQGGAAALYEGELTDGEGAGAAYEASLEIFKRLAATDPGNAGRQRDLSVSYEQIGGLLMAQGGSGRRRRDVSGEPRDHGASGGGRPGQRGVAARPVGVAQQDRRPAEGAGRPRRRRRGVPREPRDHGAPDGGRPRERRVAARPGMVAHAHGRYGVGSGRVFAGRRFLRGVPADHRAPRPQRRAQRGLADRAGVRPPQTRNGGAATGPARCSALFVPCRARDLRALGRRVPGRSLCAQRTRGRARLYRRCAEPKFLC